MKKLQLVTVVLIIGLIAYGNCDQNDDDDQPCPPNFCQNKGVCQINKSTKLPECTCRADFAGCQCSQRRRSVIQLTLRSLLSYSEMSNYKSYSYHKNDYLFKTFIIEILNATFYQYSFNYDLYFYISIGYSPGSIIASCSINMAWASTTSNSTPPALQLPTQNQIRTTIQTLCNGPKQSATCASLQIDTSAVNNVTINPNVCLVSSLNSCSQNAICINTSAVNYTCTCKPGYRDDSVDQRGTNCTEVCYESKCGGMGICHENYDQDSECRCPLTRAGRHCQTLSRAGIAIVIVFVLVLPILIVAIVVPVVIVCHKKKNKMTSSKVDIVKAGDVDELNDYSDVYSIGEFDPKYFPEKELHFDPGADEALPEKVAI